MELQDTPGEPCTFPVPVLHGAVIPLMGNDI